MPHITDVTKETLDLVDEVAHATGLNQLINFTPLAISKQNVMIKVSKANATYEFKCKSPDTVFLYIYESAFIQLDTAKQKLLIWDAINQVHYDTQKGKISIVPPQINMTIDGYGKWQQELLDCLLEAHAIILSSIEEEKRAKLEQKALGIG